MNSTKQDDSLKMPEIDMKDVDFGNAFQQLLAILKLDKTMIKKVADNKKGGGTAALFLLIGTAVTPLAQMIFGVRLLNVTVRPDLVATLLSILSALIGIVLGYFVMTIVANKLFKGKGTFAQFFRVMGLVAGINVVMLLAVFVPGLGALLGVVVGIWGLVVGYTVLKTIFHLDNTNAILTIIVTVVAFFVINAILAAIGLTGAASQAGFDVSQISISY